MNKNNKTVQVNSKDMNDFREKIEELTCDIAINDYSDNEAVDIILKFVTQQLELAKIEASNKAFYSIVRSVNSQHNPSLVSTLKFVRKNMVELTKQKEELLNEQ